VSQALKFCAKRFPILAVKCALAIFLCAERDMKRFDIRSSGVHKQVPMLKRFIQRVLVLRRCLDQQLRCA
jgi:dolichol kinase